MKYAYINEENRALIKGEYMWIDSRQQRFSVTNPPGWRFVLKIIFVNGEYQISNGRLFNYRTGKPDMIVSSIEDYLKTKMSHGAKQGIDSMLLALKLMGS